MVTLDNTIRKVGEFKGDITQSRKNYERAKQGTEVIKEEMSALEETLKSETGFDDLNLPLEITTTEIECGDVSFEVKTSAANKRPQYKTAVTQMENYLKGISFMLSQGRAITGVAKEREKTYITIDKILDAYELAIAGIMNPGVRQSIKYSAEGDLGDKTVIEDVNLDENRDPYDLNSENAENYVKMAKIKPSLTVFAKAYEAKLAEDTEEGEEVTTEIKKDTVFTAKKSTSNGVDWAYVAKTLVTVDTDPDREGELNYLADTTISKAQKERDCPTYNLTYREPRGVQTLYVSIDSVMDRINELKCEENIQSKRLTIEQKAIV